MNYALWIMNYELKKRRSPIMHCALWIMNWKNGSIYRICCKQAVWHGRWHVCAVGLLYFHFRHLLRRLHRVTDNLVWVCRHEQLYLLVLLDMEEQDWQPVRRRLLAQVRGVQRVVGLGVLGEDAVPAVVWTDIRLDGGLVQPRRAANFGTVQLFSRRNRCVREKSVVRKTTDEFSADEFTADKQTRDEQTRDEQTRGKLMSSQQTSLQQTSRQGTSRRGQDW